MATWTGSDKLPDDRIVSENEILILTSMVSAWPFPHDSMVDDPGPNELIRWSDDGSSFIGRRWFI